MFFALSCPETGGRQASVYAASMLLNSKRTVLESSVILDDINAGFAEERALGGKYLASILFHTIAYVVCGQ